MKHINLTYSLLTALLFSCHGAEQPRGPVTSTTSNPSFNQLISGHDFSCYSDKSHKTTCFGKNLGQNHSLIKNAPTFELKKMSASMHEPYACGIKVSDGRLFCWGETTKSSITDFLNTYKNQKLLAIAVGEDDACVVVNNTICDHPSTPDIYGAIYCHEAELKQQATLPGGITDEAKYRFEAGHCVSPHIKMFGKHVAASGSNSVKSSQTLPMLFAQADSTKDFALAKSQANLSLLTIYPRTTSSTPGKLLFDESKFTGAQKADLKSLGDKNILMVEAGQDFVCVVFTGDNTLACYGDKAQSFNLPDSLTVKDIAAGPNHLCAITTDDQLKCFGDVTNH